MNEGQETTTIFTKFWGLSYKIYSHEQPQEAWFMFYLCKIVVQLDENLHSVFIINSLSVGNISSEVLPGFVLWLILFNIFIHELVVDTQ